MVNKMNTKAEVISLFDNTRLAPRAVGRALVVLYNNQTLHEKDTKSTSVHNNIGFSSCDAFIGSKCAEYFIKNNRLKDWMVNYWLKKNARGTRRIAKYHRQLILASKVKELKERT